MIRLAAFLLLLALPAAAQDRQSLAEAYVALPANQQMMTEMFSPESMGAQFALGLPPGVNASEAQLMAIGTLMSGAMTGIRPQFEAAMIRATAESFTVAELQAMIEFYSSPVGTSILGKMQPYFQSISAEIHPQVVAGMQGLMPQILEIMQGN